MKPADIHAMVSSKDPIFARLLKVLLEAAGVQNIQITVTDAPDSTPKQSKGPVIVFAEWDTDVRDDTPKTFRKSGCANDNQVPVVLVGNEHSLNIISEAREVGASGYISAPVGLKSIQAWVAGIIEGCNEMIEVPGYLGPERRRAFEPVPQYSERRSGFA